MRQKDITLLSDTAIQLITEEADHQPPAFFEGIEFFLGELCKHAAYQQGTPLELSRLEVAIEIAQEAGRRSNELLYQATTKGRSCDESSPPPSSS